ncbi:hypothetical protein KJ781_04020, partial [Patescibacteria group bacterium]|nr:hypothetical protein [Patescibacteria group bacterium]MBU1448475.1 hypothetical protein [Patescibacteria group bacterium]
MKKSVIVILVVLIAFVLFGIWFWSLGNVSDAGDDIVTLWVDAPGVEVRRDGTERWGAAESGTV